MFRLPPLLTTRKLKDKKIVIKMYVGETREALGTMFFIRQSLLKAGFAVSCMEGKYEVSNKRFWRNRN